MKLDYKCPDQNKLRVILCISANPTAGGLLTLAHHLLTPKFKVEGIVLQDCKDKENNGVADLLEVMELNGRYPVFAGTSSKLEDVYVPLESEGAEFIISECGKHDDRMLHVNVLGKLTDVASAYLKKPKTCRNMNVIWAGGAPWPCGGPEEILEQDINAANVLMASDVKFWQIPRNAYQQMKVSGAEIQARMQPYGALGGHLASKVCEEIMARGDFMDTLVLPGESVYGALFNPFDHSYECLPAPKINHQMYYVRNQYRHPVRVYYFMDSRMILEDLYTKLAVLSREEGAQ